MRNTLAIFKREVRAYFTSPIPYAVWTIFLLLAGVWFFVYFDYFARASAEMIQQRQNPMHMGASQPVNVTDIVIRGYYPVLYFFLLLIIPLLTMRLLSEEKRQGTAELLLTFPIRDWEVVLGKFFACAFVVVLAIAVTWVYPLFLYYYDAPPELPTLWCCYLGLLLGSLAFISVGLFISSMTENQIISAAVTLGLLITFWVLAAIAESTEGTVRTVLTHLALFDNADYLFRGIIQTKNIIYLVNFTLFFLIMTLCSLGSARWRS